MFDAIDGIGAFPNNQEIDFRGFVKKMTAPEFRKLVLPGVSNEPTKDYVIEQVKQGRKIGNPSLYVIWIDKLGKWVVSSYEGRSRSDAFKELFGNNAKMDVHIFPEGNEVYRASHLTPEMKAAEFIPETEYPRIKKEINLKNPFST